MNLYHEGNGILRTPWLAASLTVRENNLLYHARTFARFDSHLPLFEYLDDDANDKKNCDDRYLGIR